MNRKLSRAEIGTVLECIDIQIEECKRQIKYRTPLAIVSIEEGLIIDIAKEEMRIMKNAKRKLKKYLREL